MQAIRRESLPAPIDISVVLDWQHCQEAASLAASAIRNVISSCDASTVIHHEARTALVPLNKPLLEFREAIENIRDALLKPSSSEVTLEVILSTPNARRAIELAKKALQQVATNLNRLVAKPLLVQLMKDPAATASVIAEFQTRLRGSLRTFKEECGTFDHEWPIVIEAAARLAAERNPASTTDIFTDISTDIIALWKDCKFGVPLTPNQVKLDSLGFYDKDMEQNGKAWVSESLTRGQTLLRPDLVHIEKCLRRSVAALSSPITRNDLERTALPFDAIDKWENASNIVKSALRGSGNEDRPIRICVIGLSNHGKSSFINVLIGQHILSAASGAVTAWPTLVKHNPKMKTPVLTLDPAQFEPCIELMRKSRYSRYLTTTSSAHAIRRNFLKNEPNLATDLKLFESEDPPFQFERTADTIEAISLTISRINNLMRACWRLSESPPEITNGSWPTIEVEFECWRGQDKKFEIMDLPGSGELHSKLPGQIYDSVLRYGIDGYIFVVHACNPQEAADEANRSARDVSGSPPLAAYGTHKDDIKEEPMIALKAINGMVYPLEDVEQTKRIHLCAPGMFLSAKLAYEISKDGMPPLKVLQGDPQYKTVSARRFTTSLEGEEIYNKTAHQTWLSYLEEKTKLWNMQSTIDHLNQIVIQDAYDRRQLKDLREARDAFTRLTMADKELISQAMGHRLSYVRAREQFFSFQDTVWEHIKDWEGSITDTKAERGKYLKGQLDKFDHQADEKVARIVKSQLEKMFKPSGPGKFKVENPQNAVDFLERTTERVVAVLRELQGELVQQIRSDADEAWKMLLSELSTKLASVDTQSLSYIQSEVISALEAGAFGMERAILDHAAKSLHEPGRSTSLPTYDSTKRLQHSLAKARALYQQEEQAAANQTSQLELSNDDTIVAKTLNSVGFMYRAVLDGAGQVLWLADSTVWPFLEGNSSTTIELKPTITKYQDLVKSWTTTMTAETERCLIGTIDLACTIGRDITTEMLNRRNDLYEQHNVEAVKLLPGNLINSLRVSHALRAAVCAALNDLCQRWEEELTSFIVPPSNIPTGEEEFEEL